MKAGCRRSLLYRWSLVGLLEQRREVALRDKESIRHTIHEPAIRMGQLWTQFKSSFERMGQEGARKLPVWLKALKQELKESLRWQLLLMDRQLERSLLRIRNSAISTSILRGHQKTQRGPIMKQMTARTYRSLSTKQANSIWLE